MNGAELSLWDRFKIAITPESSAESLVNEMYSPEHRGMPGLPGFPSGEEIESVSAAPATPKFVAQTVEVVAAPFKQAAAAIGGAGTAISGTIKKYAIIGFIGIALLVIFYAGTSAFIRK